MKTNHLRIAAAAVVTTFAVAGAVGTSIAYAAPDTNTVTIDAAADPAAANHAMTLFPAASDRSFTPTDNPTYTQTGWTLASKSSINNPPNATEPASKVFTATHTTTSSWSIGGSVEASYGLSALGFANAEVSAKFSANHEWTTGSVDTETINATANPGEVVWIVASHSQATFTGDYAFTANGTNYHIDHVTITEPAPLPVSGGDQNTAVTYAAVEQPYTAIYPAVAAASATQPSGDIPISQTPQLAAITADMAKLPTTR